VVFIQVLENAERTWFNLMCVFSGNTRYFIESLSGGAWYLFSTLDFIDKKHLKLGKIQRIASVTHLEITKIKIPSASHKKYYSSLPGFQIIFLPI
jgi:hypothetical protein